MSKAIYIKENSSNQGPGLNSLLVNVVVLTATSHLPNEFSEPAVEFEPAEKVAILVDNFFGVHSRRLEKDQKFLLGLARKTTDEVQAEVEEVGYENLLDDLRKTIDSEWQQKQRPLAPFVADHFKAEGLEKRATRIRMNLGVEPCAVKKVEVIFRKYRDPTMGLHNLKRRYDEEEGKVTFVGVDGPCWNDSKRPLTINGVNVMTQMMRDGFGGLKNKVVLRFEKDNCEFLYNNQVIATLGPKIFEDLELFRDAAIWIWLGVLLRHQAAVRKRGFFSARLGCCKSKVSDVEESIEMSSLFPTSPLLPIKSEVESSQTATTMSEVTYQEITKSENLMPAPPAKLAPVVSALRAAGLAEDVDKFAKENPLVKVSGTNEDYDIVLPDLRFEAADICNVGHRWHWYYVLMQKLQRSKLYEFPTRDL